MCYLIVTLSINNTKYKAGDSSIESLQKVKKAKNLLDLGIFLFIWVMRGIYSNMDKGILMFLLRDNIFKLGQLPTMMIIKWQQNLY